MYVWCFVPRHAFNFYFGRLTKSRVTFILAGQRGICATLILAGQNKSPHCCFFEKQRTSNTSTYIDQPKSMLKEWHGANHQQIIEHKNCAPWALAQ